MPQYSPEPRRRMATRRMQVVARRPQPAHVSRRRCAGTARRAGAPPCPRARVRASVACSSRRRDAGARHQRVQAHRIEAQRSQQAVFGARRHRRCSPAGAGAGATACGPRAGAVLPARPAPISTSLAPCLSNAWQPRDWGEWIEPGNREHLLALFGRLPRRDQRARLQRRLDHHRALAQRRDDPVAPRESWPASGGVPSGYSLTSSPCLRDAVRQRQVLARVDAVQPRAHHRDGGELAAARRLPARLRGRRRPRPAPGPTPR